MKVSALLASLLAGCMLVFGVAAARAAADPPEQVARLNYFSGTVTFAPADTDDWAFAQLNRPFTAGDRLWVDRGARAELHIGSNAIRLDSLTSAGFLNLGYQGVQLKITQGTANVRLRRLDAGQSYEIDTPNLAFTPQRAGDYTVSVDPDTNTTTVSVREGAGTAWGEGNSVALNAGQRARFAGTGLAQAPATDNPGVDDFDHWAADRDQREDGVSARYVSPDMTGYEDLDEYGSWQTTPDYGPVWVPRVEADWAPYRVGHWAWVPPWGWTWVSSEPWGFAPYHYGRWALVNHYWAWVPGPAAARPVYAPALVAFIGSGGHSVGWSASLSLGRRSSVAWFPLAPREAYRPAYFASPTYVRNINRTIDVSSIRKTVYVNRRRPNAITAVPTDAFVNARPVARSRIRTNPAAFANARAASSRPLTPGRRSVLGDSAETRVRPPAAAMSRHVIARHSPSSRRAAFAPAAAAAEHGHNPVQSSRIAGLRAENAGENDVKVISPRAERRPAAASRTNERAIPGADRPHVSHPPGASRNVSRAPQQHRAREPIAVPRSRVNPPVNANKNDVPHSPQSLSTERHAQPYAPAAGQQEKRAGRSRLNPQHPPDQPRSTMRSSDRTTAAPRPAVPQRSLPHERRTQPDPAPPAPRGFHNNGKRHAAPHAAQAPHTARPAMRHTAPSRRSQPSRPAASGRAAGHAHPANHHHPRLQ